jgi:glutamate racemase
MSEQPARIVITDSGLGGYSICAGLAARYAGHPLELIYFNAQPEYDGGYNSLSGLEQQLRVFDNALRAMQQRCQPHCIAIACNTLSVLYPQTQFARQAPLPVFDIINCGVEMILAAAAADPTADILILGTLITIKSQAHRKKLLAAGIPAARIFEQSCHRIALMLEHDLHSQEMEALLDSYLAEACQRLPDPQRPLLAALCCTHYPYIQDTLQRLLQKHHPGPVALLNPNQAFTALPGLVPENSQPDGRPAAVSVLSLVPFPPDTRQNISAAVAGISPACAAALQNYQLIPDLFAIT